MIAWCRFRTERVSSDESHQLMSLRVLGSILCVMLAGCASHERADFADINVDTGVVEAVESLKQYNRLWAMTQGAKPIREEFGSDCIVATNVYYTTAVTDHLLVLRASAAMEATGLKKKRVALLDGVIHSRAGEPIDVPHQVMLAIQEHDLSVATFQKLYIGLDVAPQHMMNPIEDKARADAAEFRRQYGKVCADTRMADSVPSDPSLRSSGKP